MAVGHFASTAEAIAATGDAMAQDATSVELLDRFILDLSRRKLEFRSLGAILEGDPDALLFVELEGDDEDEVTARARRARAGVGRARPRLPHAARDRPGRPGGGAQACASPASGC